MNIKDKIKIFHTLEKPTVKQEVSHCSLNLFHELTGRKVRSQVRKAAQCEQFSCLSNRGIPSFETAVVRMWSYSGHNLKDHSHFFCLA